MLLLLANFAKDDEDNKQTIEVISQQTLAQIIGTTRVSSFMNKFRKQGFIDYDSGITINTSLLNFVLLDRPYTDE